MLLLALAHGVCGFAAPTSALRGAALTPFARGALEGRVLPVVGGPVPACGRAPAPRASLVTTVVPALGAALANAMFFSGLPEVLERRKEGNLGEFNPLPMPIILGNTFGWTAYSLLTRNPFVAAANAPGLLLATWYVLTTTRLADAATAKQLELTTMVMAAAHTAAGLACAFVLPTRAAMVALYGLVCNAILLAYYGAPLSTIGKVLKERSAASIYVPTVLLNGLNALFWSSYAVAINDLYILVPNAIGFALSAAQTVLCVLFGKKEVAVATEEQTGVVVPTGAPVPEEAAAAA